MKQRLLLPEYVLNGWRTFRASFGASWVWARRHTDVAFADCDREAPLYVSGDFMLEKSMEHHGTDSGCSKTPWKQL